MRIRPLRYRDFVVFTPMKVPGGYTTEFYSFEVYHTLRPYRTYRQHIKPLYNTFRLDFVRFDVGAWFFFELPRGVDSVPLPEHLARLKHVADEFRRILEGE